jgi:hypothetical protein
VSEFDRPPEVQPAIATRADGERPTWSEFLEPGLETLRNVFTWPTVTTDAPAPTHEDPLGIFNAGVSVDPADGTGPFAPPELHAGSFKTDEGRDAFGIDASVGAVDMKSEASSLTLRDIAMFFGGDSLAFQRTIPLWADDFGIGFEAEAATAGATMMDDGVTTEVGAALTAGGAAMTIGNKENNIRLGLSEGPSLAGRAHRGDVDQDLNNEFGFGFDAGIWTFDLQSERLDMGGESTMILNDDDFWSE